MKISFPAIIFVLLFLVPIARGTGLPASLLSARPTGAPTLSVAGFAKIDTTLQAQGTVRIFVRMIAPADRPAGFVSEQSLRSASAINSQRAAINKTQSTVLSRLSQKHASTAKRFNFIPYMALEVDQNDFLALTSSPEIDHIQEDIPVRPALDLSVPLMGGINGTFQGFSGTGQTVAILDTGVDKTHPFLQEKVIAEACFSTTNSQSSAVCTSGSTLPGSGANCSSSIDGCDHGTHVAGIAAGKGDTYSGVARDATIIAVQVFSSFPASVCEGEPCVMSWSSDQVAAMEHIYDLKDTYNIAAVNMSLGGGTYSSYCDNAYSAVKAAIDALRSVGIATVIASGNDSSTTGISFPACISSAVSVGAATISDNVASYSNSAAILSLLAPGSSILSSVPGGTFESWNGTSMATPHVAGAWAVMKSAKPGATVDEILSALSSTGKGVTDYRNAIIKPRIQLDAAVRRLLPLSPAGDFDGDSKADPGVWRSNAGSWFMILSDSADTDTIYWGSATDKPVPGDYDADGKTDIAVWRPANGAWLINPSSTSVTTRTYWGGPGDIPVARDYDGDGKTDIAIWRPSSGAWAINLSATGVTMKKYFGSPSDIPVPADYDGDSLVDIAIWRPATGAWIITSSKTGIVSTKYSGDPNDIPVPGDYDGDGKADIAIWRPSTGKWVMLPSSTGISLSTYFGSPSDIPLPMDYDGDGKTDIAIWRSGTGTLIAKYSSIQQVMSTQLGTSLDKPIPGYYLPYLFIKGEL